MLSANLPQERLTIAVTAQATAIAALNLAVRVRQRAQGIRSAGRRFPEHEFVLAECATDLEAGQALVDRAIAALDAERSPQPTPRRRSCSAPEMQSRVIDKCLQLHGGYGYMREYPIARMFADARVSRIFGGTSEVMKSVISKSLNL